VQLLLVADSTWVRNDVEASLPSDEWSINHADPRSVVEAAIADPPTAVLVDMQVGSMGGMAVIRALRDAIAMGKIKAVPLILMLDRRVDQFIADRAGADRSLLKPFTAQALRNTLAG
jgi:DNA-binding response OmpR family regulator